MSLVSYDPTTNEFVIPNGNEVQRAMLYVGQSKLDVRKQVWRVPARKDQMKKLKSSRLSFSDDAQLVADMLAKQADYFLDFDEKANRFELFIDQGKGKAIADQIGGCSFRKTRSSYSIPNNLWSLQKLYTLLPKEFIEPSDRAKEKLAQYTEKVKYLESVVAKIKTIKPVPVEKIDLDGFSFDGQFQPYEHQLKMWWSAYNLLKPGDTGFFFFCGVGTGKSLSASNVAVALKRKGLSKRALVITPSSLKYNFAEQVEVHTKETVSVLYDFGMDQRKGKKGKRRWRYTRSDIPIATYYKPGFREFVTEPDSFFTVVSYEAIVADWRYFKGLYDFVILDEAHYIKNRTTNRTRSVSALLETIPRRLGMTGTPVAKDPLDLWSLYDCIDPDIFPNRFGDFENALVIKKMTPGNFPIIVDWKDDGLKWVNDRIYERAIQYRTRECIQLPERRSLEVTLDMPDKLQEMYDSMKKDLVIEIGEMGEEEYQYIESPNALASLSRLRQLASGFIGIKDQETGKTSHYERIDSFKVDATIEFVESVIDEHQVMIWYHHTFFQEWLAEKLKEKRIPYAVIKGKMSDLEIASIVHQFQHGFYKVLISNLSKSEGYTATAADIALFPENSYSYLQREQAEGRIERQGQKNQMLFVDIVASKSIDVRIIEAVKKKEELSERVLLQTVHEW